MAKKNSKKTNVFITREANIVSHDRYQTRDPRKFAIMFPMNTAQTNFSGTLIIGLPYNVEHFIQ